MITIDKIQNTLSAHEPRLMPLDEKYRAAVAMVFHNHQDGLRMLFIERTKREGDPWSGHLAFPGGRMETEDEGPRHTAERETYEEIGFTLDAEAYVGRLDDLSAHIDPIKVSGFVYMVNEISSFALSEEVSEAFWMPFTPSILAEHAAKQSNKRKRMAAKDEKDQRSAKKYKEFKF